ncbi:acyl-CoA dehydrogenase family protein [Xanthobacter sp. VNH20]|uniref:acyl-CoA dehydrogenase family protein n=1 Tax=Xanthobacter sp. VNH20 TaxID=3156616 RepID=UPI0032B5DBC3
MEKAQRLRGEFAAHAAESDRQGRFSRENIAALHANRLLALAVPREFGGRDVSLHEAVAVVRAIGAGDPSTALVLLMQMLHHRAIAKGGTWPAHIRARVFEAAVKDGALINALRVEPALGSPVRGGLPATVARRVPEGWRISGRKLYSTGSPALRWGIVWGATDEEKPRVGEFLVPLDAPGVSIVPTWDHLGLRASGSDDVVLEDVLIPADHAVDLRRPEDWVVADVGRNAWLPLMLAGMYDGVAQAARDWLVGFLKARTPSNIARPLSSVPRIQAVVGEIEALLQANDALLEHVPALLDSGGPAAAGVNPELVKYTVTTNAIAAVEKALGTTGNHGLTRVNPLERHYRDVLCSRVHQPQNDLILEGGGRRVLAS